MKPAPNMEVLMRKFITTVARKNAVSPREKYLQRETMHSLIRLTKSEELMSIKSSLKKLIPAPLCKQHIRGKSARRKLQPTHSTQGNLAFGPQE